MVVSTELASLVLRQRYVYNDVINPGYNKITIGTGIKLKFHHNKDFPFGCSKWIRLFFFPEKLYLLGLQVYGQRVLLLYG